MSYQFPETDLVNVINYKIGVIYETWDNILNLQISKQTGDCQKPVYVPEIVFLPSFKKRYIMKSN